MTARLPATIPGMVPYVPIPGMWGGRDRWYQDPSSPFIRELALNGFIPMRSETGQPFRYHTMIDAVQVWRRREQLGEGAKLLVKFLASIPPMQRHVIAYSYGGLVALLAAAGGLYLSTLTTVGTPARHDINVEAALPYIGFWQHIYDADRDDISVWGTVGDWVLSIDRTFEWLPQTALRRYPEKGIGHGGILTDEALVRLWSTKPWLSNIRQRGEFHESHRRAFSHLDRDASPDRARRLPDRQGLADN